MQEPPIIKKNKKKQNKTSRKNTQMNGVEEPTTRPLQLETIADLPHCLKLITLVRFFLLLIDFIFD
jgi:hypothetical protein